MRHTGVRRMNKKREPDEKQIYKMRAKAFVESISRKCFGYNYKGLTLTKHARRNELKYKLTVVKHDALDCIRLFQRDLEFRFTDFKVFYSGCINTKTNKEEWHIEIIVFGEFVRSLKNERNTTELDSLACTNSFAEEREAQCCA